MKTPRKSSRKPRVYRATVIEDEGCFIAEVTGLRAFDGGTGGVMTQGEDLDELTFMIRNAIELITDETNFSIELLVPPTVAIASRHAAAPPRKKRRKAA